MKYKSLSILHLCTIIWGIYFLLLCNSLLAQTYGTQTVSSTDPDPKELFHFQTPGGTTGTDKVIIAKFVVDDMTSDLEFRLEPTNIDKYHITDFKISQANVALNDGDTGDPVATLRVRDLSATEHAAAGFRIIKISVRYANNYVFTASEVWKIKAKQPTIAGTTLHYWGFWAEGTGETTVETTVTRPRLIEYISDVTNFGAFVDFPTTKNISFGEVHINLNDALVPQEPYQFINVGTQALDMVSVTPATMPVGAYSPVNYPGSASDVLPLAAFTGTVFKCKPTSLGPIPDVNISISVNSTVIPALNINLIDAIGIQLNTALLVDISGSMNDDIHGIRSVDSEGRPTNDEEIRKIFHAREAGKLLAKMYHELLPKGRFGLFTYPNLDGDCPSSQQVVFMDEIEDNYDVEDSNNDIIGRLDNNSSNRIKPEDKYYLTPMAHGIGRVYDALPKGVANNRSVVFMIGDGQHYCDSSPPKRTPADWQADLHSSGIKFYTIPYGDANASWTQQLKDISNWTNGTSYPVNITDNLDLRKRHENAVRDALSLQQITDPGGNISRNQRISHSICVPEDDYTLTFIVRWESNQVNAISATLLTPEGQSITPQTAQSSPNDVGYFPSQSYLGFVVRGRYLAGRAGTGQWKLNLTGSPNLETTVRYAYSVYAQSTFKTSHNFNLQYAGDKGLFELAIGDENHRMRNVEATLEYRVPTQSFGTYLATTSVEPELIFKAPDMINGNRASLADKKYYALENFLKKPYDPKPRVSQLKLVPISGYDQKGAAKAISNAYRAVLEDTKFAGIYDLTAVIKGVTLQGDCFQREVTLIQPVGLKFVPDLIQTQVRFEPLIIMPFFPKDLDELLRVSPPQGIVRKNIVFTPQDSLGNYWGPGKADQIKFNVKIAEPLGSIVDNLDGSYIQVVQYKKGANPSVTVTARDVTSPDIQMSEEIPFEFPVSIWILLSVIIFLVVIVIVLIVIFRK